jgi:O-antigen/teichoic acid export membrane protein
VARILLPEDYGYLLIFEIFTGVLLLFSFSGFEAYFIQKNFENEKEMIGVLKSVFILRVYFNVFIFFVQVVAGLLFIYFNSITIGIMLLIMAPSYLITLLIKPGELLLIKGVNFKHLAIGNGIGDFFSSICKILFALLGFGAISFAIGQLIGLTTKVYYVYRKSKIFPNDLIRRDLKILDYEKVKVFGVHSFISSLGGYLINQTDKFFVSTTFQYSEMGYYQFAKKQSSIIFLYILKPLNALSMTMMAKYKSDINKLSDLFKNIGFVLSFFLFPFFLYAFFFTHEIVILVFSDKWLASVSLVRIFLIYYALQLLNYPINGLLTTLGRPDVKAKVTIVSFIILLLSLIYIYVNKFDIIYYASVFVIVFSISDLVSALISFRLIGNKYIRFLADRFYLVLNLCTLLFFGLISVFLKGNPILLLLLGLIGLLLIQYLFLIIKYKAPLNTAISIIVPEKYIHKVSKILRYVLLKQ